MFFGILFGIGIIVAFARYEATRAKRRADLVFSRYYVNLIDSES